MDKDPFLTFLENYDPLIPELSVDDLVFFLNEYPTKKFSAPVRQLKLSEVAFYERNILIDFGQWNKIPNEIGVKKMRNLFKLCKHGLINILVNDLVIDPSIKKIMDEEFFIDKLNDGKFMLFEKKYWEDPFESGEAYTPITWNYYLLDYFDKYYEDFMRAIKPGVDFNMQVFDTFTFTYEALKLMKSIQAEWTKEGQMIQLYEEILSIIWTARNYWWKISLSYPIRKYAKEYGFYFEILTHLHEDQKLNLAEISFDWQYVNFVVERISDFDKRNFEHSAKRVDISTWKSEYDSLRGILRIGWMEFNFKTPSKANDLLGLLHSIRDKDQNGWLPFSRISEEYLANKGKYRSIAMSDLNYRGIRDLLKNRLKEIENKLKMPSWEEIIGMSTSAITLNF